MTRILFASPYKPFPLKDGVDPLDPFTGQLSPTQGPFAMTMHSHYFAFYLLAENLDAESCVLEHPTLEEFEAEVSRGYDYLGLQVNWNTLRQTALMIARARSIAPQTKIVVGGYAVAQIVDPLPPDAAVARSIRAGADYLCHEEGVAFMRRLLKQSPDQPIRQYTTPKSTSYLAAIGPAAGEMGERSILISLGCPAGCDFCNTSAFFKQRKIQIASPDQAYGFMRHYLLADGGRRAGFALWDEDLFWDPEYPRALGKRLRDDPATLGRIGYFTFGSVRTLSRLDPEELVANGLGTVWIGVESTLDDALQPSVHLGKLKGRDVADLFRDLQDVGIHTTGSMILGFDFHRPENVGGDIDAFVALAPTVTQVTPLVPCAGTRLYKRIKQEGRLNPQFGWTVREGLRYPPMSPLHFSWEELQAVVEQANRRLYLETGPSALKSIDVNLRGHLRLRKSSDRVLRTRAEFMGESARMQFPMIEAVIANAPSARVRERAQQTSERWKEAFGEPDADQLALGRLLAEQIRRYAEHPPVPKDSYAPPTLRTYYRPGSAPEVINEATA